MFGGKDQKILTYTDTNYAQQADHHSILGYCLIFGAGRNKILLLFHQPKPNTLDTLMP